MDDEPTIHEHLSELLEAEGFAVRSYLSADEAGSVFATHDDAREFAGVVLTDLDLPGELDGLGLMERIHAADAKIPVLLLTGYSTIAIAVEAMKRGAYDFVRMAGYRAVGSDGPEQRSWTALERALRERVLRQRLLIHSGNMKRVADELGIKDRTLRQWCSDLRINRRDYLNS